MMKIITSTPFKVILTAFVIAFYVGGSTAYNKHWIVASVSTHTVAWADPSRYCLSTNVSQVCQPQYWDNISNYYYQISIASGSMCITGYVLYGMCIILTILSWCRDKNYYHEIATSGLLACIMVSIGLILWTPNKLEFRSMAKKELLHAQIYDSVNFVLFVVSHVIGYFVVLIYKYKQYKDKQRDMLENSRELYNTL